MNVGKKNVPAENNVFFLAALVYKIFFSHSQVKLISSCHRARSSMYFKINPLIPKFKKFIPPTFYKDKHISEVVRIGSVIISSK